MNIKQKIKSDMKHKIQSGFIVIIILIFSHNVTAQNKQYLDVWGGLGYSSLNHGIENTKVPGGFGYSIGVGYEYDVNNLIFLAGAEFSALNSKTVLNSYSEKHIIPYPYIPNYDITYNYTLTNYNELHSIGLLNFPLQAGLKFGRYYGLLGLKVGLNMFGTSHSIAQLQTTATDPMLIGDLEDMPNHYLGVKDFDEKGDLSLGLNIAPSLEVGVILDDWIYRRYITDKRLRKEKRPPYSFRAGLFFDYGVVNLNTSTTTNQLLTTPVSNPMDVDVNGLLSTTLAQNKRLGSMLVGAKFTVKFELPNVAPKAKKVPPVLYAQVVDAKTKQNLVSMVTITETTGKKKRVLNKATDKLTGIVSKVLKPGKYQIVVSSAGYPNYKSIIKHTITDTLLIAMQPKPVPQPLPILYVCVQNAETNANLQADVSITPIPGNKQPVVKKVTNKTSGIVGHQTKTGKYLVNVAAAGYINTKDSINLAKNDTLNIRLEPIRVLYARVINAETKENVSAEVVLSSLPDNKQIFNKISDKVIGVVSTVLKPGNYQLKVTSEGFINYQEAVSFSKSDTVLIALQAIKKNVKVVLENLFFELNSAIIQPASETTLNELYQFMQSNPNVRIQIVGHTDNQGSASYNQRLSQNRAKAVNDALVQRGITPSRIAWVGKGSSEPVTTNDTDEGKAKNRRVEFIIQ